MLDTGRVGDQHQTGHARFEHQPIVGFQSNDNSLANPFDRDNFATGNTTVHDTGSRHNQQRFYRSRYSFDAIDLTADSRQNPASHCFHFRQFWHFSQFLVARDCRCFNG